jgi:pimeloyl-ACP methyl ester carboxylesterase
MNRVTSKDGTSIAYERIGSGPTVILVGGGAVDRSENASLAPELAEHFTVYNYDRRGRGDSGDTLPYAVEREIEDIEALIAEAGGPAHLYGVSSGGALALEAAAAGIALDKIAVYEVPYSMADDASQRWREYVEQLEALLAEGRRGDAFALFMRVAGASEGGHRVGKEFADVARPGGHCAHARIRCSLLGKRPVTHCPPRDDHAADLGGHGRRESGLFCGRGRRLLRSGRGRDRREYPAGGTSDH